MSVRPCRRGLRIQAIDSWYEPTWIAAHSCSSPATHAVVSNVTSPALGCCPGPRNSGGICTRWGRPALDCYWTDHCAPWERIFHGGKPWALAIQKGISCESRETLCKWLVKEELQETEANTRRHVYARLRVPVA